MGHEKRTGDMARKAGCGYENTHSWNQGAAKRLRGCRRRHRLLKQFTAAGDQVGYIEWLHQIRDAALLQKGLCLTIEAGESEKHPAQHAGMVLGKPAMDLDRAPAIGHGAVENQGVKATVTH